MPTRSVTPFRFLQPFKDGLAVYFWRDGCAADADLVLLDANPILDIRNTQRINAVVSNGRLFDRKALDKMLDEAQGAANR